MPTNAASALNAGDIIDGGPQGEAKGRVITPRLLARQRRARWAAPRGRRPFFALPESVVYSIVVRNPASLSLYRR